MHGGGNVVVLALFAGSWLLRLTEPGYEASGLARALAIAGVLLALVTGWLGGELINRLGLGVDRGANLDAPSSLSGRPASERSGIGRRAPATRR